MKGSPLHLGVDIGTQGARAVLVTTDGEVISRGSHPLTVPSSDAVQEQRPADWWEALVHAVRALGPARKRVVSMAISCTSGSVCALDAEGEGVGPGLLYADRRAIISPGNDASWAVAKIAWMASECADIAARAAHYTSPGGYIATRLLGRLAPIDVTQALKFGFDPEGDAWGPLPVPTELLPLVVPTGSVLGPIEPAAAADTGLPADVLIVAGATDGVAGQFACRPAPDRWATAIGSTIVWKAMSSVRLEVADSGIYSHRGPDGWWLPGAASNAGARILSTWATEEDLRTFGTTSTITPEVIATYPGVVRGERFPFADPGFEPRAVSVPSPPSPADRYAAEVLGIAFVERWGCEALVQHGCPLPATLATTGGVVASPVLMQLRSDVLQLPIEIPAEASSAFGAAVIAAAPIHGGVLASADAMVHLAGTIDPDPSTADRWTHAFGEFRSRCSLHRGADR
jgi:sugar (pentulose or hexulose) kinase